MGYIYRPILNICLIRLAGLRRDVISENPIRVISVDGEVRCKLKYFSFDFKNFNLINQNKLLTHS